MWLVIFENKTLKINQTIPIRLLLTALNIKGTNMQRVITQKYTDTFDYDDYETIGYLIGGELLVSEPSKRTKKIFEGDWSEVTKSDVWSWIHNSEEREPVTFWHPKGHAAITIYPNWKDNTAFKIVHWQFTDK